MISKNWSIYFITNKNVFSFESQINNLKAVLNKMESTTTNLKFDT